MDEFNSWMNHGQHTSLYGYMKEQNPEDFRGRQLKSRKRHLPSPTEMDDSDESSVSATWRMTPPLGHDDNETELTWALLKRQSRTELPEGRHSMLVDIGSRINVVGCNTERAMSLAAAQHNYDTKYTKRTNTLHVNGVGAGSAP